MKYVFPRKHSDTGMAIYTKQAKHHKVLQHGLEFSS